MPRVSVCIPAHNAARFLAAAIESVLRQTFADFELILCDNASSDETPHICQAYTEPRVRYVRYDELVSQGGNWNRCLRLASGEYVGLLHADDEYNADFLASRVAILDRNPGVGLAFGAVEIIDEQAGSKGVQRLRPDDIVIPPPGFFGDLLLGCVVNPASPLVRRSCYQQVGFFNERRLWGVDWEMWLRLAAGYGVAYCSSISARYRVHGASGSTAGLAGSQKAGDDLEVLKAAFRFIDERPDLKCFSPLKRQALHCQGLRALYAAGFNCEIGNRGAVWQNLRYAASADLRLALKPTFWVLALAPLEPRLYALWRRIREA